jgi:hypothetical protein
VQAFASLHEVPFATGSWTQPTRESQRSAVQGLLSSQSIIVPGRHAPDPLQRSPVVHALPSVQVVVLGAKPSAGHTAAVPVQFSATSHTPAAGRHSVLAPTNASAGQAVAEPEQRSATSQSPAASRQTADAGLKRATQVALAPTPPEHSSCASQSPEGVPPHAVPVGFD